MKARLSLRHDLQQKLGMLKKIPAAKLTAKPSSTGDYGALLYPVIKWKQQGTYIIPSVEVTGKFRV